MSCTKANMDIDIPKVMQAIVKVQRGRGVECREVPVPEVGKNEVLIKVHAGGICGSDIHMYQWNKWASDNMEKIYGPLPHILGHEFSGEIVAVGEEVTNAKIGDRVASETHLACGQCYLCKTGNSYNCQYVKRFKEGVFAEYALVPADALVMLPDNMTYDEGAALEPFSVATHAASMVSVVGDTVAVIGAGPIGLFAIQVAKAMGASKVYVSDASEYRLELAKKAGADMIINAMTEDVVDVIMKDTDGLGCGTIFEFSGNVGAIKNGFRYLRKCGNMVMAGLPSKPLELDVSSDIVLKAAKIYGVYGKEIFKSWEISKGLIASGRVKIDELLTHRFKFSEADKGFELAENGLSGKVLLYPDAMMKE